MGAGASAAALASPPSDEALPVAGVPANFEPVLLRSLAGQTRSVRRPLAVVLSMLAHVAVIAGLAFAGVREAVRPAEPEPVRVSLRMPRRGPPPAPAPPKPAPRRSRPPEPAPALVQPPPVVEPEPVPEEVPEEVAESSEAVAEEGAATSGETAPTGGSPFGVASDGPLEMRQLGQLPVPRESPPPDYPRKARDEGIEGRVVLRVVLSREGKVEADQIRVVQSVPALDAAAIAAVLKWRFSPGVDPQGRLVRVVVDIPFEFSLR
jgi:periplasmic protein TonB